LPGRLAAFIGVCLLAAGTASAANGQGPGAINLELQPRVCTLTAEDEECNTPVRAQWRSRREESLCLVIVGRPEVKHCWERYSAGTYTLELIFQTDLTVELRDTQLQHVLASRTVKVIREALQLRRKRRQPWSIVF
jgi:DUF3019 family protein